MSDTLSAAASEMNKQKTFSKAATGLSEPTSAMYYNDQPPHMIFYQGLARQKLVDQARARSIFLKLVDYDRSHIDDDKKMDYFAVSLPNFRVFDEDLNRLIKIHCHYIIALGYTGLELKESAEAHLRELL